MLFRVLQKFNILLNRKQKIRIAGLVLLMILGGFLEMLSVSVMLPLMNAVMNPGEVMEKWYAKIICGLFRIDTSTGFLILTCVLFAVLYIVKNVYLLFEKRLQYKFVYNNMFAVESRLLRQYLRRPYEFYLNVKSAEIIRIVNNDTTTVFQMLFTLLHLFSELVVSAAVITVIFWISPVITSFVAMILIGLVIGINFVLKPIMNRAGKENQETRAGLNKWLMQAIHGIKEVKVMRKEEYFRQNFDQQGKKLAHTLMTKNYLADVPKMLIESVSMSAIFVLIAVLVSQGKDLSSMIPDLTMIAMAAIRLLPSANQISSALGTIAYSESMLDKVLENSREIRDADKMGEAVGSANGGNKKEAGEKEKRQITEFKHRLELNQITYRYPMGNQDVLAHASMVIRKGETVGISGPSGAGKTTTVDIILGLLKPQGGEVLADGFSIYEDLEGWLSMVGYIPQTIFLLDGSIRTNIAFGIRDEEISDEEVWRALEEASLSEFVRSLPKGIHTEIGERGIRLSGGQRQRVGIARALYLHPEILIMDEATSSLDQNTEKEVMEAIRHLSGKKTIIIIAHRLSTLDLCDRIYHVEGQKVESKCQ